MSRTVSARIPQELHEKLRDKCNNLGCSINDYLTASIDLCLNDHTEFDFGDEADHKESYSSINQEPPENHGGKIPIVHFYVKDGKLIQGETTWRER